MRRTIKATLNREPRTANRGRGRDGRRVQSPGFRVPDSDSSAKKITALVERLLDWFARHARDLPWRRTRDPYAIWVSEIMLQQTQVKTVVPYWERWMRELPTLRALARAAPATVHKLWEGLGYYVRARNLHRAAQQILARSGGQFPQNYDEVLTLPGIGRYTAGAMCSIAFNQPTPVLDGNVVRVLARLFGIAGDPRERRTNARLWHLAELFVLRAAQLEARIPRPVPRSGATNHSGACSRLNQSLMELGAVVCTPRKPRCGACPLAGCCVALHTGRVEEFPAPQPRPAAIAQRYAAFIVERDGRFLVRQRPAGVVNAHLWEFPNAEAGKGGDDLATLAERTLGTKPTGLRELCSIRHSITRYRIKLDAYVALVEMNLRQRSASGRWMTLTETERLAFTSAHGRIRQRLMAQAGAARMHSRRRGLARTLDA